MLKLLSALLLCVALSVSAQTSNHTHAPDMIDGAKNPELIPDLTAWRLWMLSVTEKDPDHPELDQQRQDAFLRAAGYEEYELPAIRGQLHSSGLLTMQWSTSTTVRKLLTSILRSMCWTPNSISW